MSTTLKQMEIDFTLTMHEPVETEKAMELVIMTVPMMIQTTICLTLTTVEVSLQVQV